MGKRDLSFALCFLLDLSGSKRLRNYCQENLRMKKMVISPAISYPSFRWDRNVGMLRKKCPRGMSLGCRFFNESIFKQKLFGRWEQVPQGYSQHLTGGRGICSQPNTPQTAVPVNAGGGRTAKSAVSAPGGKESCSVLRLGNRFSLPEPNPPPKKHA